MGGLMRKVTGAEHVLVMQHLTRSENPKEDAKRSGMAKFQHAYAGFPHLDIAVGRWSAKAEHMCRQVLRALGKLSKEQILPENLDVAYMNLWKPYDRPVFRNPLVILD